MDEVDADANNRKRDGCERGSDGNECHLTNAEDECFIIVSIIKANDLD